MVWHNDIVDFLIPGPVLNFLNIVLVENNFIYVSIWSFIHLFSGVIFFFFFSKKFKFWIVASVLWELFEHFCSFSNHPFFVERLIDTVWDVVFNLCGFGLAYFFNKKFGGFCDEE